MNFLNPLLLILLLFGIWRAWRGAKNGFAEEISRLVGLIAALFVLALILMIVTSFRKDDIQNGVIAVIFLLITGILLHLFSFIMKALKSIASLPLINLLNGLLGVAAGVAEVIVAAWLMYYLIELLPQSALGDQILRWTEENEWLTWLYEANYITQWLSGT
jgi:uncharacterized membrane protein required for colicin V production